MFQKPFRVKSQTQLKGSEKKKLNAEIIQNFPALSDDDVLSFLPSKADVNLIKAYCHRGEIANIYQIQKEPLFFKIDKSPELYPTVYLLYKFPYLLRTFTTSTPVVSKLMQGAGFDAARDSC
ncbi:Eukaryotic translation initiation factor 2D [Armadillidium vulgare]|nr:Eukaryotic translation initiation factor 2D [Armadillidium vulgare]